MSKTFCLLMLSLISTEAFARAPLTVVLVIDQFRADWLTRRADIFVPKGDIKNPGGFAYLASKGAFYPYASHDLLSNMTGPGHANISTGALPYRHGIVLNTWFDRATEKEQYCVGDSASSLIGFEGEIKKGGMSPRNLEVTTIGDELKLASPESRVASIAIKDRAAILMGGHLSDATYWFEDGSCQWVTSRFYVPKGNTPAWMNAARPAQSLCNKEALASPLAITETFRFAKNVIAEMKLGQRGKEDLLFLSVSSHDYRGHKVGSNAPEMDEMVRAEDVEISQFLKFLAKKIPGGLKGVNLVLTADHGGPAAIDNGKSERFRMGGLDEKKAVEDVRAALEREFGKSRAKLLVGGDSFQFFFKSYDAEVFAAVRKYLSELDWVERVLVRIDGNLTQDIPADLGRYARQSLGSRSGDIIAVPKAYRFGQWGPKTIDHVTANSYDRLVPLLFVGPAFQAKTFFLTARVQDLAPTLAATLGILPPSASEGRILSEALH